MNVKHIAKLANLHLKPGEEKKFQKQFADTLQTIAIINELDTSGVQPTSQVTGLVNVIRKDVIDTSRLLPPPAGHNGYYVAPYVFE